MIEIKHQVESEVMRKLYHYQQENILCDVLIFVGDGSVPAHRLVLAATCPYFSSFEETELPSYRHYSCPLDTVKGVNTVLKYLYTGELIFDESDFNEILQLCKTLKLLTLASSLSDKYSNLYGKVENEVKYLNVLNVDPFESENKVNVSSVEMKSNRSEKSSYDMEDNSNDANNCQVSMYLTTNDSQQDNLSDIIDSKSDLLIDNESDCSSSQLNTTAFTNNDICFNKLNKDMTTVKNEEESDKLDDSNSSTYNAVEDESQIALETHETTLEENHVFRCSKCLQEFTSRETFVDHIRNDNCPDNNTYEEETDTQKYIQHVTHLNRKGIHVMANMLEKKKFLSAVDKIPVNTRNVVDVLFRKNGEYIKKDNLTSKVEGKITTLRCFVCREEFLDLETICQHKKLNHPKIFKRELKHCEVCGSKKTTWINMMEHKLKAHGITEHLENYNILRCTYQGCHYITLRKYLWNLHLKTHEEKKVVCHYCNKKFQNGRTFKEHLLSHEKEATIKCDVCGKMVVSKLRLQTHMKIHTKQEKNMMCHLCTERFKSEPFLEEHILQHHKQIPEGCENRLLCCSKCDYRTLYGYRMRKHERHHQRQENPEIVPRTPCEVCGKLVMTENYKSHYKYAHGEKHIKCTYEGCSYATSEKRKMENHILSRHKDIKPFSCQFCNYRCKLRGNLTKHLSSQHQYEEMTLTKRRKLAFETGENYPSTIIGNRAMDRKLEDSNFDINC